MDRLVKSMLKTTHESVAIQVEEFELQALTQHTAGSSFENPPPLAPNGSLGIHKIASMPI